MDIRNRRLSKNLTQQDIAEALNVSRTTVTMWETGETSPRVDKLPKLARILECTVDELLNSEESALEVEPIKNEIWREKKEGAYAEVSELSNEGTC